MVLAILAVGGGMVMFVFVLILVAGVNGGVMVVFGFVVGDMVMLLTGVNVVSWWCSASRSVTW
jgi:hypothetical protein